MNGSEHRWVQHGSNYFCINCGLPASQSCLVKEVYIETCVEGCKRSASHDWVARDTTIIEEVGQERFSVFFKCATCGIGAVSWGEYPPYCMYYCTSYLMMEALS